MRLLRIILLVILVVVGLGFQAVQQPIAARADLSAGCQEFNVSWYDGLYTGSIGVELHPDEFWAGEVITIITSPPYQYDTPTQIELWFYGDAAPVATGSYPGTLTYVVPADTVKNGFWVETSPANAVTWNLSCTGPASESSTGPGPDMVVIPSTAVVGMFTEDTALYYLPQLYASTGSIMTAGKTLWVFGMDNSKQFYQVLLNGRTYWVPAASIGPNPDEVWNNTPLPTTVVE